MIQTWFFFTMSDNIFLHIDDFKRPAIIYRFARRALYPSQLLKFAHIEAQEAGLELTLAFKNRRP
jgi:hypothetical protein